MYFFIAILGTLIVCWNFLEEKYLLNKVVKSSIKFRNKIILVDYSTIPVTIKNFSKTPIYFQTTLNVRVWRILYDQVNFVENKKFQSKISNLHFYFYHSTLICTLLNIDMNCFKQMGMILNVKSAKPVNYLIVKIRRLISKLKIFIQSHFFQIR